MQTELTDIERKVYQILWNDDRSNRVPSLRVLCRRTGRREGDLIRVLAGLAKKGFIEWRPERPDMYRVLTEAEKWQRQWMKDGHTDAKKSQKSR